jgi:hypothetical protein
MALGARSSNEVAVAKTYLGVRLVGRSGDDVVESAIASSRRYQVAMWSRRAGLTLDVLDVAEVCRLVAAYAVPVANDGTRQAIPALAPAITRVRMSASWVLRWYLPIYIRPGARDCGSLCCKGTGLVIAAA